MINRTRGGCLCGFVRFEYSGTPGPAGYCHCADCRKVTGGPFGISAPLKKSLFTLNHGQLKAYTKTGDSGNEITRWFCPECGSPIYTSSPAHPDVIYIKAGALDDPTLIKPVIEKWTISKVDWADRSQTIDRCSRGDT